MAFDEKTVNGMRVLAAIVDSGSFVRAGEALEMSQSGVSRAVARLEARLNIRLFDRTTRKVSLTDEGRRFYAQIHPLLAGLEDAVASAGEGAVAVRGKLRVNIDPLLARLLLGPRLGAFLKHHPELELDLFARDHLGDMVGDGIDLAIRLGQPQNSSLIARKLLDTRVLTVATPAYLRKHGTPKKPIDLESAEHTCIHFRNPATGRPFDWEFHHGGKVTIVHPRSQITLNDAGAMESVLLSGYGLAQVIDIAVEPLLRSGALLPVLGAWPDERFPLYALYPSRQHPPAKTRAFLEFFQSLLP
ncbi:LysR family transcriptional regulator [Pseudoduganella sp. FT25W]|uniref:LysR family transcriptional regulator n=1 Tax=Duganella alba TaxID=2666081 RepID=A0A6L5QDE0_9BURK|nr:LysR family transcriptional regulator [Duganella alba]MRX07669.1 LysR family transcriptional regulator [Duganella alba]MRX16053.1 LysR family transcriptional regulator [Duganella alba]